jgi:hypothetical protein
MEQRLLLSQALRHARRVIEVETAYIVLAVLEGQAEALPRLMAELSRLYPVFSDHLEEASEGIQLRVQRYTKSDRELLLDCLQSGPQTFKDLVHKTELSVREVKVLVDALCAEGLVVTAKKKSPPGKGGDRKTVLYALA